MQMQSNQNPGNTKEIERVIQDARQVIARAQRLREQSGLPAEAACAVLESQLSEKDVAEVRAAVKATLEKISAYTLNQSHNSTTSSGVQGLHKRRPMI